MNRRVARLLLGVVVAVVLAVLLALTGALPLDRTADRDRQASEADSGTTDVGVESEPEDGADEGADEGAGETDLPRGTVSLTVTDTAGHGVGTATVQMATVPFSLWGRGGGPAGHGGFVWSGHTDAQGRFTQEGVDAGRIWVRVSPHQRRLPVQHLDRAVEGTGALRVTADEVLALDVELSPASVIRGRVRAPEGTGLEGRVVEAQQRRGRQWVVVNTAISAKDGGYTLRQLAPGEYRVVAEDEESGRVTQQTSTGRRTLPLSEGERLAGVDLVAAGPAVLVGRVVDQGRPIADTQVQIATGITTLGKYGDRVEGHRSTRTDAAGWFRIEAPGGSYTLWVGEGSWVDRCADRGVEQVRLVPGEQTSRDVALAQWPVLSGTVRDDLGRPVPGALVAGRSNTCFPSAETDAEGRYRVTVRPGRYELAVQADERGRHRGASIGTRQARPRRDLTGVDATVPRAARIAGEVRLRAGARMGERLAGIEVVARRVRPDGSLGRAVRTAWIAPGETAYEVDGLMAGRYRVSFEPQITTWQGHQQPSGWVFHPTAAGDPDDYRPVGVRRGGVHRGIDGELSLGGPVTGEMAGQDGEPAVHQMVTLARRDGSGWRRLHEVVTDEAGRFVLRGLTPGDYRVVPGDIPDDPAVEAAPEVTVRAGERVDGVRLEWEPAED